MLKGQLDLDKCVPKGLDGDGLPVTGKGARLFTFEVSKPSIINGRLSANDYCLYESFCVLLILQVCFPRVQLQYTHAGSTSVHKFQALSPTDIARWKTA